MSLPGTLTTAPATTRPRVRRLTGLKPTGHLHLGNLLGAIRPVVAAQPATAPGSAVLTIADLHALTVDHRPHDVRARTLELVTTVLAAGVDPDLTTVYVQSHVPAHCELHYLLECVTGYGEAHRMIQFKERASGGHTRLSLLTYPVLMAADILLHDVDEVPVGDDQVPHLELARDLATRFNARYGDTFTVPVAARPEHAGRVMDLADPTGKMGKSTATAAGTLYLLDPPETVRRKIGRAVTDDLARVRYHPDGQPGVSNLLEILAGCTGTPPDRLATEFRSYGQLKAAVSDAVIDVLAPIQRRYRQLRLDQGHLREVLAAGADRARNRAAGTLARARRAIGLLTG